MVSFAADENFNKKIVSSLLRKNPELDIVCVQDIGLKSAADKDILEWAARENRVSLTHDASTVTKYAMERLREKKFMPGIFEISFELTAGKIIDDLMLIAECSEAHEWENKIEYLPL